MRKEKQKGGWEKIKVKEDKVKGGRNEWLRKKKREVKKKNKSKRWCEWDTCPSCKEFYKIKITNCVTIQQIFTKFSQRLRYQIFCMSK